MARKPKISSGLVRAAEVVVCKTSDVDELRQGQAILLPVLFGLSLSEVGQVMGRSKATVSRLQARFRTVQAGQESPRKNWGGRRRQNMSLEEESSFLEPFFEKAKKGGMVVVSSIKAAYEKAVGRSVPASTIYRMLARHGWRKITPIRRHPKADPVVQQEWKKNFKKS